ncbi:hypothetical protein FIV00_25785 [Labrenzia sp. THAF82]|uniref:type III secretion system chaperone n=1 Tax=Labrenzia sp. THAF82 TaxID=2587861 RepID=UPI001267C860|nr:type III secretion system chaperone [Labrenzia sp. THAF82]QFT33933.1 hypothetical protein FIV00_25785 [Labrenzia sp. THAF82]
MDRVAARMITRHDVSNALAKFSRQTDLGELSLGPDDVVSAEFGDEGVVAICFDEKVGCVRLLSPVGQLEPSMPIARRAALLRQTLAFNIENMSCLGMEHDAGVFLLTLQIWSLDGFVEQVSDFGRQSIGVSDWLENFDADEVAYAEDGGSLPSNETGAVVLKP